MIFKIFNHLQRWILAVSSLVMVRWNVSSGFPYESATCTPCKALLCPPSRNPKCVCSESSRGNEIFSVHACILCICVCTLCRYCILLLYWLTWWLVSCLSSVCLSFLGLQGERATGRDDYYQAFVGSGFSWQNYSQEVMVNLLCHLDWAMGFLDSWSSIILGISMRLFLDVINIEMSRLSKEIVLSDVGGPHLIRWRPH